MFGPILAKPNLLVRIAAMGLMGLAATGAAIAWSLPARAQQDAAGAQPSDAAAPSAQTYTLQFKYASGQLRTYKCTVELTGSIGSGFGSQPINQRYESIFTQFVQAVRSDGAGTIQTHLVSVQLTAAGRTRTYTNAQLAAMQPPIRIMTTDGKPDGGIIVSRVGAGDPNSYLNIPRTQVLPDFPVGIGESWRSTVFAAGQLLYAKSTLEQVTQGDAGSIARIGTKFYGTSGQAPTTRAADSASKLYVQTTGSGVTELNTTDGSLVSVTDTLDTVEKYTPSANATGLAAQTGPVTAHMSAHIHMEALGNAP
jgi:hypothetical protein